METPQGEIGEKDSALLRAIAARDADALAQLYDERGGLLFALCVRILKDRMAAEEALEDVFWEVWNRADRYDPARGSPISYLLNLTRSRAIDKLRGGAKLKRMHLATDQNEAEAPGGPLGPSASHTITPIDLAVDAEQRNNVRRAVGRLNPEQRRAVELAFFEGLTHSQISEELAVPLGTIKTRIRQALVHLREALGNRFGHDAVSAKAREASE